MISWQQPIKQQRLVVCRFWRWQLESSHLRLAGFQIAPKYERDERQCMPTPRRRQSGEITELTQRWHCNAGVRTQNVYQKDVNATSLLVNQLSRGHGQLAQYHGRCRLDRGKFILCDSYVTSVPHASLHPITLVDTRAKMEHVNGRGEEEDECLCKPRLPSWHAALQQGLEKSFTVHVPRINKKICMRRNCWHVLHSHAWLRMALAVKGWGHLAPKRKWEAKSPQILRSLFAFIPMSEEKQLKTHNPISLKTSFSVYYLQQVTDNSSKAGNLISESVLYISPPIY